MFRPGTGARCSRRMRRGRQRFLRAGGRDGLGCAVFCKPRGDPVELIPQTCAEGLYVDLLQNPERFTGYAGDSSSRVWKAIYEENCFSPVPYIDASRSTSQGGSGFASLSMGKGLGALGGNLAGGAWGEREKRLMGSLAGPRDGGDEICLEKRVFYRLISG